MTSKPFISIIIATYNIREYVEALVVNLNSQTFIDYEVLISDGGSTDGSRDYFKPTIIRNLTWMQSSPDGGIYYALNKALDYARGTWIAVIGADDKFINENALANFYDYICNIDETYNLVYTDLQIKSKNNIRFKNYPGYSQFKNMYGGLPPIHHQTAFFKRSCVRLYGKFDTTYRIHADYELFSRIMSNEAPLKIDLYVVLYNDSGFSSNWSNIIGSLKEMIKIRYKYNSGKIGIRIFLPYLRLIANKVAFK